jgi:hypothetical protein
MSTNVNPGLTSNKATASSAGVTPSEGRASLTFTKWNEACPGAAFDVWPLCVLFYFEILEISQMPNANTNKSSATFIKHSSYIWLISKNILERKHKT